MTSWRPCHHAYAQKEDGSNLGMEDFSGRSLHALLVIIVTIITQIFGLSLLALMYIGHVRVVNILYFILSILVGIHYIQRQLFDFDGDLLESELLPVFELPSEAFAVQRSISSVPWFDHRNHPEGSTPIN